MSIEPFEILGLDSTSVSSEIARRVMQSLPGLKELYSENIEEQIKADATRHLKNLDLSIRHNNPRQFENYICWVARVVFSRGVKKIHFLTHIQTIQKVITERLPEGLREDISDLLTRSIALVKDADLNLSTPIEFDENISNTGRLLLQSLLEGRQAWSLLIIKEAIDHGLTLEEIYLRLIQPVMYEVGRRWEMNEITVAHEHIATAIVQFIMSHAYSQLYRNVPQTPKGRIVLTGVAGEMHGIGLRMVRDILEFKGWEVLFLGTDLPENDIIAKLVQDIPSYFGISVTLSVNLPKVVSLIGKVRQSEVLDQCKMMIGGNALQNIPDKKIVFGADIFTDGLKKIDAFLIQ